MKFAILLLLSISTLGQAKSFSVGPYAEYPLANGIETRFNINNTLELELKAGIISAGYVRAASQAAYDSDIVGWDEAIVFDNSFENGFQFEIGVGTNLDSINSDIYIDGGYGYLAGSGTLSSDEAYYLNLPFSIRNQLRFNRAFFGNDYSLSSQVHYLHGAIGHRIPVSKTIFFKSEFSIKTIAHHTLDVSGGNDVWGNEIYQLYFEDYFENKQDNFLDSVPLVPTLTFGVYYGFDQ